MPPPNDVLNDELLVRENGFNNRSGLPLFLVEKTKDTLLRLLVQSKKDSGNIVASAFQEHNYIWVDLLRDAITYLKKIDKREYASKPKNWKRDKIAFGVNELYKYFIEYQEFEGFLYGADQFYRDHVAHVFRVWLIGCFLLNKIDYKVHWDYEELLNINRGLEIKKPEIEAMWCIIALTHDLGYPLDKNDKILSKINEMMRHFGSPSQFSQYQIPTHHFFINDFILEFISSKLIYARDNRSPRGLGANKRIQINYNYITARQSKYYLKFSKSLENLNHGIISCILLMKNLVYFLESDLDSKKPFSETEDARQFYIRREILRAIASHTCTDIYHIFHTSLPFLLIIADELQIWKRPNFQELKGGGKDLNIEPLLPLYRDDLIKIKFRVKRNTEYAFTIKNENKEQGEEEEPELFKQTEKLFKSICKKWVKWLRGALDASRRDFKFSFQMTAIEDSTEKKIFEFNHINKTNHIDIKVNGKEEPVETFLFKD
ncbi:MAG: hypothetical protein ABIL58_13790 [Pseudomonadota bacterium]